MNIEESIIEFKKMIERDKDTLRYWESDTSGHYCEPIKKLERDVLISETLLTAYEKEKEEHKRELEKIIQILEAKPYTAYTLYGDILHESDEIAQMLKEVLKKE